MAQIVKPMGGSGSHIPHALAPGIFEQHSKKTEPPKGQGENTLLVDDKPRLVDIVSRQLVGSNYRAIKASNGNEALNLYEEHREQISVIILDLLMPEMDGKRCIYALQDIPPQC